MNSKDLWVFFFIIGVLLFNWPLLAIFGHSLQYYLFVMWAAFIVVIGIFIKFTKSGDREDV